MTRFSFALSTYSLDDFEPKPAAEAKQSASHFKLAPTRRSTLWLFREHSAPDCRTGSRANKCVWFDALTHPEEFAHGSNGLNK
jgi:hypothetical protein